MIAVVALLLAGRGESRAAALPGPVPHGFRVIVHPQNPVDSIERSFAAAAFLKKVSTWPHGGGLIQPVDLHRDAPARREFTRQVLNRSTAAIRSYWQQIIFAGRGLPPPEQPSDEAAVQFVLRHPGALGYVSPAADVSAVKAIALE